MMHEFNFDIGVTRRGISDELCLSSEAIDALRGEMFTEALKIALLEAVEKGIYARHIRVVGKILVENDLK